MSIYGLATTDAPIDAEALRTVELFWHCAARAGVNIRSTIRKDADGTWHVPVDDSLMLRKIGTLSGSVEDIIYAFDILRLGKAAYARGER